MKRTLENIDRNAWYHEKSLDKYFKGCDKEHYEQLDDTGKTFDFVVFRLGIWNKHYFVVNPETKRLRYHSVAALEEIGFVR